MGAQILVFTGTTPPHPENFIYRAAATHFPGRHSFPPNFSSISEDPSIFSYSVQLAPTGPFDTFTFHKPFPTSFTMNLLYLSALLSTLPLLSFSAPTPAPIQIPHHPLLRRDDAKIDTNTPLYSLPKLPFKLEGLEPVISKALVDLHYNKHHQAYVTALNGLLAAPANLSTQLANNENIRFNGGGHINHSLFWGNLAPPNSTETKYPAAEEMISDKVRVKWKTWDGLKKAVVDAGLSVKGSGWVWLVMDGSPGGEGSLQVVTRPNQDTILEPLVPILGIDVW